MAAQQALPQQYRKILRFVRRRAASAEDAEDLTQEVFAAAASLAATDTPSPTLAWLYTVAQRRIIDEGRRRSRARTVSLQLVEDPAAAEHEYGGGVATALDAGLATLPEGQRRIVVGRLLQGRSFAELAREVGASEDACRMRFMRGLQHLRAQFEKEGLQP